MTSLVHVPNDESDLNDLEKDLTEAVAVSRAKPDDDEKPSNGDNDTSSQDKNNNTTQVPDKYRNKSVADLIEMHQNLESAYGRMANDLGTQRKLTDQLLELKRTEDLNNNSDEPVKVSSEDLLDNPTQALDQYFESRSRGTKDELAQRLDMMEQQLAAKEFTTKHPDYNDIAADPQFSAWINASQLRQRAAQMALSGDWSIADELLTEFKDQQGGAAPSANDPAQNGNQGTGNNSDDVEAARAASLESASQASDGSAPPGKTYSRTALQRLRIEKPHVYSDPAFQEEILRAYSEGRVK